MTERSIVRVVRQILSLLLIITVLLFKLLYAVYYHLYTILSIKKKRFFTRRALRKNLRRSGLSYELADQIAEEYVVNLDQLSAPILKPWRIMKELKRYEALSRILTRR